MSAGADSDEDAALITMGPQAAPNPGALGAPDISIGGALDLFTRGTTLSAEHRRLMQGRHRAVPWDKSTAPGLSPALRASLAELWRARMLSEHRSVGVFSLYVLDLLGAGAPAEILSLACRAALDEVRHAELFSRLASLYSGHPETPPPGIPPMPDDPSIPIGFQVAREALQLSVLSETYSSVLLHELHARARDPAVRGALGIVIADEVHHARMGWAFLAARLADDAGGVRAWLAGELCGVMDGLVAGMFGDPTTIPPPEAMAEQDRALAVAHGFIDGRDEYRLFCETLAEVWVPGLGALGLDATALVGRYPAPPEPPQAMG